MGVRGFTSETAKAAKAKAKGRGGNKVNTEFKDAIKELYPNYHPVIAMAVMANDKRTDETLRFNAHKEVAKYFEPQLKGIEHKGHIDTTETITVEFYDAQKGKST